MKIYFRRLYARYVPGVDSRAIVTYRKQPYIRHTVTVVSKDRPFVEYVYIDEHEYTVLVDLWFAQLKFEWKDRSKRAKAEKLRQG